MRKSKGDDEVRLLAEVAWDMKVRMKMMRSSADVKRERADLEGNAMTRDRK